MDAGVVALVEEAASHSTHEPPRAVRTALVAAAAAPAVEHAEGVYVCEVPEASSAPQQQQHQQLAVALLLGPCDTERCAALVAHPTAAAPSSRMSLNVTAAPLQGGVAVRIFGMINQTDDAAIHCVFTDAAGATTTTAAAAETLTSEEAAMGARAATCVAPASVVQGAGTMALHHTCRALTAPLAFHRYVAPVVTALEETAGPRFGAWTTYVRVSSALRPALAAFLASSSPAALRCRLVNATSGAAVAVGTATLMAENDDPDAASRVQCALGSDLEPLPAGPHRLQLWLGGRALGFAQGETGEVTLSGPRVAMVSSHEVVTDSATYTAIALELTGACPSHGHIRREPYEYVRFGSPLPVRAALLSAQHPNSVSPARVYVCVCCSARARHQPGAGERHGARDRGRSPVRACGAAVRGGVASASVGRRAAGRGQYYGGGRRRAPAADAVLQHGGSGAQRHAHVGGRRAGRALHPRQHGHGK